MKSLRNILLLLIASGILTAGVITGTSMWGSHSAAESTQRALVANNVTADIRPPALYLIELRLVLSQTVEGTMPLATAQSEAARLEQKYRDRAAHWKSHPPYGLEAQLLGEQHAAAERFIELSQHVLAAVARGQSGAAQAALEAAHAAYRAHRGVVDDSVKASAAFAEGALASLDSAQVTASSAPWMLFALSAALLVALGLWARRTVWAMTGGEPAQAAALADTLATGDLSVRVAVSPDDTRSAMAAMARMRDNLGSIVSEVRASSDNIAARSAQIAHGNQDLWGRTERLASALEQTAAAMDELGATVTRNAENARRANELALGASRVAAHGGGVVTQVVETMKEIDESSKKIAQIIGVIDGIAFQANVLALNAAVEAARAGDQGGGFAVVASDMRGLAQRSAEAAKEIKGLITASVARVEHGSALADEAGVTVNEVVGAVVRVTGIMGEISGASGAQAAGVAQVGLAVKQIDQAAQQNAALVGEHAAAAESLKRHAEELQRAVALFKLPVPETGGTPQPAAMLERRGPNRAVNVERLPAQPGPRMRRRPPGKAAEVKRFTPKKTAQAAEDWQEF